MELMNSFWMCFYKDAAPTALPPRRFRFSTGSGDMGKFTPSFLFAQDSYHTSNESERKGHPNRVTVDSAVPKNVCRNLDVSLGCIQAECPPANVPRGQVIMPILNLAVHGFSSDAQADFTKDHEIGPTQKEQRGANPIERFRSHSVMSPNDSVSANQLSGCVDGRHWKAIADFARVRSGHFIAILYCVNAYTTMFIPIGYAFLIENSRL